MSRARLLVLGTVAIWSFGTLLGRVISHRAPYLLLHVSFLCSLAVFLPYAGRAGLPAALRPRHLGFGLFGYFLYSVALMLSFRAYGRASEPTVLNYTWPVFTVLLTPLFAARTGRAARRASLRERLGIALCFLAVLLLATGGDPRSLDLANGRGVLFGLSAGLSYGVFSAYSSTVPASEHASFLLAAAGSSAVAMIPFTWNDLAELPLVSAREWLAAGALGALVNGAGYATWTLANRLAAESGESVASVASLAFLLPLLSLCAIAAFLGEGALLSPAVAFSALMLVAGSAACRGAGAEAPPAPGREG